MIKKLYIGIDIGGTKTRVGLITGNGRILKQETVPTAPTAGKRGGGQFDWLDEPIRKIWDDGVAAIGIGIAGLVDFKRGIFLGGPNLPKSWAGLNLAAVFKRLYRRLTVVDNDAKSFALGEYYYGAGRGTSNLLALTLGTGIGGGLVVNGKLLRGADNGAGEFGHMTLGGFSRLRCTCGGYGHFESLAAGPSVSRRYRLATGRTLNATEIDKLAKNGDREAKKAINETAHWLGLGLANLVQTLNPDAIVIGGGAIRAPGLFRAAKTEFKKLVSYAPLRRTPIIRSTLGADANIIGAAILAKQ